MRNDIHPLVQPQFRNIKYYEKTFRLEIHIISRPAQIIVNRLSTFHPKDFMKITPFPQTDNPRQKVKPNLIGGSNFSQVKPTEYTMYNTLNAAITENRKQQYKVQLSNVGGID